MNQQIHLEINTDAVVLTAEYRVHKTGRFLKETRGLAHVDVLMSKIAEAVILDIDRFPANHLNKNYKVSIKNDEHCFLFCFRPCHLQEKLLDANQFLKADIVFFGYTHLDGAPKSFGELLTKRRFKVTVTDAKTGVSDADYNKLYRLSNSSSVNFPLLNAEQKAIVMLEDQNVLVQGVAGSGKTNVCIDKIVFTACRAYKGRILYSTFSRGLLIDTQTKIKQFIANLKSFAEDYSGGRVIFADDNHKRAIENKLGIYFSVEDDDEIYKKVIDVTEFLENNVDYFLIEDLYNKHFEKDKAQEIQDFDIDEEGSGEGVIQGRKRADESFFVKTYIKNIRNHQLLSRIEKASHLSYEVIYKEIYGMIFGCFDLKSPKDMLTLQEYTAKRKDNFSASECEAIWSLGKDYGEYLVKQGILDNNGMSRKLLKKSVDIKKYSLAIIDEVQDMTEVNLCLIKALALKVFCVGDALQMINPSYFSFAYLKRLLFEKDVVSVAELSSNYRNTERIAQIVENLSAINMKRFGVHSFVLRGASIGDEEDIQTAAIRIKHDDAAEFVNSLNAQNFNNYTIIVQGLKEKELLRGYMQRQEILTVAEIKGLERDIVVLYNVLSDNIDKWNDLERMSVNRKQADENSVYRYYFNLFYVALSRAKTHIYVAESKPVKLFDEFFRYNFELLGANNAITSIITSTDKAEAEQDEILERVRQFLSLEQFDNARFAADKILDPADKKQKLFKIDVYEQFVHGGRHRDAGIKFWEAGMNLEAKEQFSLAGDDMLVKLVDACLDNDARELNADIVSFLPEVASNQVATKLIMQVLKKDLEKTKNKSKKINEGLRSIRRGIKANGTN